MDLIKLALKAIFYDLPIEKLLKPEKPGQFLDVALTLIPFRDKAFSLSEIDALKDYIKNICAHNPHECHSSDRPNDSNLCFVLLHNIANELLKYYKEDVRVDFQKLFKWRSIVKDLGEDILIIPFIAHEDFKHRFTRTSFDWGGVLRHNNDQLNKLLDDGLCDIHSHLGAATEIFELNWINIMNDIKDASRLISSTFIYTKDIVPQIDINGTMYSLSYLCAIAASIRVFLFNYITRGIENQDDKWKQIFNMHDDEVGLTLYKNDLQHQINTLRLDCAKLADQNKWDYALNQNLLSNSPSSIYAGERKLLYDYYFRLAAGDTKMSDIAEYVFIYESIKIRFRKELVQTNTIVGLKNFTEYNDRKSDLLKTHFQEITRQIAIRSSIRRFTNDALEARINVKHIEEYCCSKSFKHIFNDYEWYDSQDIRKHLSFIVHFIKSEEKKLDTHLYRRYRQIMKRLEQDVKYLVCKISWQKSPMIVGIDSAGLELNCRPEAFGHAYRYYKASCNNNMTYHVGEDFYDIADGLRAIEETIIFCNMEIGTRLGHCLALGINPYQYYKQRYRTAILPKQVLLDNLVWVLNKIDECELMHQTLGSTRHKILQKAYELYSDIGYDKIAQFDILSYYNSMFLRSDDVTNDPSRIDVWEQTSLCQHEMAINARKNKCANELCEQYKTNYKIKTKGDEPIIYKYPDKYEDIIYAIQEKTINYIENLGIAIECNPTSNINIGHIDKYEQHPIFRFYKLDGDNCKNNTKLKVSINTDDKGIFATSLPNEFSLMALAIMKMKKKDGGKMYNPETMIKFVSEIIESNEKQRFKILTNHAY